MPRQLVRLNEVRRPLATSDQYTSAQIQGAENSSVTTEDYLQYVLSQIRLLAGTPSWKALPAANMTELGEAVAPAVAFGQQIQDAVADVATLTSQVSSLTSQVAAVAVEQTQALNNANQSTAAQLAAYGQTLTQIQAQLSNQAAQIAALVTPQGLIQSLAACTLFDQPLSGVRDNKNRIFVTPQNYALSTLRVYRNGMRLFPGLDNDYTPGESAQGLGYDQVVLSSAQAPPAQQDLLTADFIPS